MKIKLETILTAVKISAGVAKSLVTGKPAKILEKTEEAAGIAKAVKKLLARR